MKSTLAHCRFPPTNPTPDLLSLDDDRPVFCSLQWLPALFGRDTFFLVPALAFLPLRICSASMLDHEMGSFLGSNRPFLSS